MKIDFRIQILNPKIYFSLKEREACWKVPKNQSQPDLLFCMKMQKSTKKVPSIFGAWFFEKWNTCSECIKIHKNHFEHNLYFTVENTWKPDCQHLEFLKNEIIAKNA